MKRLLPFFFLVFLVSTLTLGVYLVQKKQNLSKKAAETKNQSTQTPEYAKGEVLVKLRSDIPLEIKGDRRISGVDLDKQPVSFDELESRTVPFSFQQLNKRYKIENIEKVFKGVKDPQTELAKFKSQFSKEISENKRKINEAQVLQTDLSKIYKLVISPGSPLEQVIEELKKDSNIAYAEPNRIYKVESLPNDPYYLDSYPNNLSNRDPSWNPPHDYQWNIKRTNSSENWQTDTSGVIVAVLDSGVDITHPELGNIWVNPNEIQDDGVDNDSNGVIDDVNGANFVSNPNGNVADDNNHGTHVAGIISAKTNNNVGIAGVTTNTPIMVIKVINAEGYGRADEIAKGTLYGANNGAKVINISLGGGGSRVWQDALDVVVSLGVIPVVAAGNGNNYSADEFPASYRKAITVGGVDEELDKLRYANYGPNIDIVAPAGGKQCLYHSKPGYCSNIISLKSSQNNKDLDLVVGEKYFRLSGTSMATPHVAGVIALLLAQHPEWTFSQIENYFRFNSSDSKNGGHTERLGWGILNSKGTKFVEPSNIDFRVDYPAENSFVGSNFNIGGTISADNFDHYSIQYRLQNTQNWILEGVQLENNGRVEILPVTTPDGSSFPSKIGSISLPASSPRGSYEIKITLYMTNNESLSATKTVYYLQKQGTDWLFAGEVNSIFHAGGILTADLDNNGKQEIILYNYGNYGSYRLKVFDSDYHGLWEKQLEGEVVVGNIDKRTTEKEVVLQTAQGIRVYDFRGNEVGDMKTDYYQGDLKQNILIVDADNNGTDELYFYAYGKLYCFEQTSSYAFEKKWELASGGGRSRAWPMAGDLDGDGKKEIVAINSNSIISIDSLGNSRSLATILGTYPVDGMVLADLNRDRKEEVIIHVQWGDMKLISYYSGVLWSKPISNNLENIEVADFNHDSYPDIYLKLFPSGEVKIIDYNGDFFYEGYSDLGSYGVGIDESDNLLFSDKDNNGSVEIFHAGFQGSRQYINLQEYNTTLKEINYPEGDWKGILSQWTFFSGSYFLSHEFTMAITDLENNGKLDLIIAGVGIMEYDTNGVAIWPNKYHDFQRTNSYEFVPVATTSTPSPTPTNTPIPTFTPTPTTTPTPTPGNNPPTVTTATLPVGRVGRMYSAEVKGRDADLSDTLTMTAKFLPRGLFLRNCRNKKEVNSNTVSCRIIGIPESVTGPNYNITVLVSDGKATTSKRLKLRIKP